MAGVKNRSGAVRRVVFSWVTRVSLTSSDADLMPFFEGIKRLPAGKRNAALLAAIRGGAASAGQMLAMEDAELAQAAGEFLV